MNRRFEALAEALPQLVWSTPPDGLSDYFSVQWEKFTGAGAQRSFGLGWLDFVHPDDVPIARAAWQQAVEIAEPYTVEYRLRRHDGEYCWMLARGLPVYDDHGRVDRWIGTCTDINERVRISEELELMSQELSHRIKNLFAVAQSLITMALRRYPAMAEVNRALQSRMVALGRAHDLVRPRMGSGASWRSQTTLRELINRLIEPFQADGLVRVRVSGDDLQIDAQAATPLALFFHELITNSIKFGALSCPAGNVAIEVQTGGDVTLVWRENGGPVIAMHQEQGFGVRLVHLTVERQLGGKVRLAWLPDGLTVEASIPLEQINRR